MDILNEKIEGLVKKAEKSGMPYGILKKVYDRGMAAWRTGHRPGTTPQQWAFARVNSFVTKSSGTWGGADKDLAKQVKGESTEVPRTKSAKELIGQIKEKLPKDADAGDYVKDFRKSKAPQFKGKSDKKIQKMAIAAYLDSKEEVTLERNNFTLGYNKNFTKKDFKNNEKENKHTENAYQLAHQFGTAEEKKSMVQILKFLDQRGYINKKMFDVGVKITKKYFSKLKEEVDIQELINFDRQLKDPKKEAMVMFTKGPDKGRGFVIDKKDLSKFERQGAIRIESNDMQEMEVKYIHTKDPQGFMNTYQGTSASKGLSMLSKDSPRRGEYLIKGDKKNHDAFQKMLKNRGIRPEIKILKEENCPDCNEDPCKCKSLQESNDIQENNKENYMWGHINMAMMKAGLNPRVIRDVLSNLNKFKKMRVKVEDNIQESGHTDVPSMKTQVQIAMDALQKMNTELGKLSDEDELPTWWTNKVATAVNKLDGMADYIDAKHDQGQKMNEEINEQTVFTVRFEKEGMRFASPFYNRKNAENGMKVLKKSQGVTDVSITKDILKPGMTLSKKRTQIEGKIIPESKMGAFFLDMQIDANEMSERDFIKKYQGEMGMTARELKDLYREMTEEVDLDEDIKGYKPHVTPRDTLSYHLPKQKKSMKAFFDLVSKHPKVKNVKQETLRGRGGTVSKIDYDTDKNTQAALMRELDKLEKKFGEYAGQTNVVEEVNLQEGMSADTAKAILKMRAKDKFEIFRGDYVPMIYLSQVDRQALKDAGHKMTHDIPKPTMGTTVTGILNVANGSSKSTERAGMYDTETDDMKGKNPAVINMKKFVRGDFQKVGYPKTVGDLVKMTGLRLNSNDPMSNEEVDNSLMAQATRVISQTAIREKIDPADIDVKATAADRKAADKNIIIQLRRAQDMEKQTGRADQSGIEFLDKKKQKVDPKIINKALDMFDKMKPNDKAKMQKTIGKSYRDLLKTVQRGRI